mgnify:CR=1 FL=1
MTTVKDWLNQKFTEWEKTQGHRQSYYAFARYLEVSQSGLAQWMTGSATPGSDDLAAIAGKLGPEIYDVIGLPRPSTEMQRFLQAFASLPPDIRQHMMSAILEVGQSLRQDHLRAESADARRTATEILQKWGFDYQG